MSIADIPAVLFRRRLMFVVTFLACAAAVVTVTKILPKTYEATATLYVGSRDSSSSPDELVRTYAALAGNANIADSVRRELPFRLTRSALLARMSFAPVPRTQLLEVTAAASTAERARLLANTYSSVYAARVADQFAANKIQERVSLSEAAALPSSPAKPNPPLYIGLGLVLSLLLAAGAVALRETLTQRPLIRSGDSRAFDLPVLGRIPKLDRRDPDGGGPAQDAFQWLKTSFDAAAQPQPRVVAVASPSPGDGKSTIVANLAAALAAEGERVVVIEADLRRPGLHSTLLGEGLERSETGLADYLSGDRRDADVIVPHPDLPGVNVIWSGTPTSNPVRLLRSPRFGLLLTVLAVEFDRVILDTPPIAVGPDAALAAAAADETLLVIDLRRTTLPAIRAGIDRLRLVGASIVGTVLNHAPAQRTAGYDYAPSVSTAKRGSQSAEQV